MARFDVYRTNRGVAPLVVDVQADIFAHIATRIVIPLLPAKLAKDKSVPRLNPVLTVDGKNYALMTAAIGPVRTTDLGDRVATLEDDRHAIIDAVDFLFQGF